MAADQDPHLRSIHKCDKETIVFPQCSCFTDRILFCHTLTNNLSFQSCCIDQYLHGKSLFADWFCLNLISFMSELTWAFIKMRKIVAKQDLKIK